MVGLLNQLGNQLVEFLLEAFRLQLLLRLYVGEDLRQAGDFLFCVLDRVLILLLYLEAGTREHAVELAVQVDLVALCLERFVDPVEVLQLEHEV